MIFIKSADELDLMRKAGRVLSGIAAKMRDNIEVGMTTQEIDSMAEDLILGHAARPAFKGYHGFPASVCTSINEEVVHGMPSGRSLKNGDLLKLDIGVELNGYFSDCAFTLMMGKVSGRSRQLVEATRKALQLGMVQARDSNHLSDISWAIQSYVESQGFAVVRDFVGHGIGRDMHEPPEIPNFGQPHNGPVLQAGMVLAIEPMVNMGTWQVRIKDNGWTAVTKDNLNSAHFEHTIIVGDKAPEILTNWS